MTDHTRDEDGFHPDDFAAALSPLLSAHEGVVQAGLSNNFNVIVAALRRASRSRPMDGTGEPVVYQQRELSFDGKTWGEWYPSSKAAWDEHQKEPSRRYEIRALYAHPPALNGSQEGAVEMLQEALHFISDIDNSHEVVRKLRAAIASAKASTPAGGQS